MLKRLGRKGLVVGIIILFVGASVIPLTGSKIVEKPSMPTFNDPTIVSIQPQSQTVEPGESFYVSVYIEPGEPIVGINFNYLYFDETIIQANSVTFDGFFEPYSTIDSQSIGLLEIDNVNGEIRYVFEGILGAGNVSANGSFVTINFTAQDEDGVSLLELDGVEILDPDTNQVPTTINNGTVIVGEPQNNPPYEPSEPNPEDGAGEVSVDADLSWTGGDPDPGDTVTYDIYFGTTSPPPQVVWGQSETTYDPGTMNYNTQYYWQIVAWDDHGASNTSDEWDFTTEALNSPPYAPYNPDPYDGETDVDVDADLSWTGGDPDSGDIVTYDVYFGTTSPPPQVVWGQSGTTYNPGTMSYNTQYYWQIVAWDNHGASTPGPIWDFTTEEPPNNPPYVPSNPNPSDGATDVERPPSELSVTIEDPDGDIMDIYIIWRNHDDEWITLETYSGVDNGTYNFAPPSENDWIWGNTTYNWGVNVTDGDLWTNETYQYTTCGSRYDVNNDDNVNFQDAGLVWVHRTSEVAYDGIYDVNQDGEVNFQDAGLTWINRD